MKIETTTRRTLMNDECGDARIGAFFALSAILTVVMATAFYLAPPANIGVEEGQLAPNIITDGYISGAWEDFELYDNIDRDWEEGQNGQFILLQFMDTDCPHCWNEGDEMSSLYSQYGAESEFNVLFITVSVDILPSSHSKAEIAAFKDKTDLMGCNHDDNNCQDRPGDAHPWMYLDGMKSGSKDDYQLPGVPFELLLSPDGVVVWNASQGQDRGQSIENALYENLVATGDSA
jgi:hypothetical protein